jgi:hypothetical protein
MRQECLGQLWVGREGSFDIWLLSGNKQITPERGSGVICLSLGLCWELAQAGRALSAMTMLYQCPAGQQTMQMAC